MKNQEHQKPHTTARKQDPQRKPDQHEKDRKDRKDQNQPGRSGEAKRVK
jgi:hypothetical protein